VRVNQKHLAQLVDHGFVVVPRFLAPAELKAARKAVANYFPSPEELALRPLRYRSLTESPDFQQIEFPYMEHALNHIALHPKILDFVSTLLGTDDVMLSRSALWAKYAGMGDFDQPMHADFEGNTLVYPRDDGDYRQVNIILYYSDVDETLGPTHVVSQRHTRSDPLWPPFRPREEYPEIYDLATPIITKAGGMLIFSMRAFHRGTAITADFGARFTHHLVYRAKAHGFQGYQHWPSYGEQQELHSFLERATPRQREALGFPKVGDPYWNTAMIEGVAKRYPGMDMRPYRKRM
jgi:hypothetical protein